MAFDEPSTIKTVRRLCSALTSGQPAAYIGMSVIGIGPLSRKLTGIRDIVYPNDDIDPSETLPPAVLMISPPRSGSTLIYQVLTRTIPCVYISNLHLLNVRGASQRLCRSGRLGAARGFNNYYGYTPALHDIHEGNEILAALFYEDPSPELLRRRFIALSKMMGVSANCPLLFKNVRFHPRAGELAAAVPELHVVRIQRLPEQIIQSVVRAYHDLGYFHPVPDSLKGQGISSHVEFAVRMVQEIQRTIDIQLHDLPEHRKSVISYEAFCEEPWINIRHIAVEHLGISLDDIRENGLQEVLKASNKQKVSDDELQQIQRLLI